MFRYILKRFGYMLISLFIIMTITFFLMKLMPGSPFNDAKLS
ncbi:ABC transporter permease, partial [Staphylococcus condimenti]